MTENTKAPSAAGGDITPEMIEAGIGEIYAIGSFDCAESDVRDAARSCFLAMMAARHARQNNDGDAPSAAELREAIADVQHFRVFLDSISSGSDAHACLMYLLDDVLPGLADRLDALEAALAVKTTIHSPSVQTLGEYRKGELKVLPGPGNYEAQRVADFAGIRIIPVEGAPDDVAVMTNGKDSVVLKTDPTDAEPTMPSHIDFLRKGG